MPHRPKQPCAYPGCPRLANGRYCEEHQKQVNSEYERNGRDPETKKRYGRAWEKIRKMYVDLHPFCEKCLRQRMVESNGIYKQLYGGLYKA